MKKTGNPANLFIFLPLYVVMYYLFFNLVPQAPCCRRAFDKNVSYPGFPEKKRDALVNALAESNRRKEHPNKP